MDLLSAWGVQSLLLFAGTVFVVNATPGADLLLTVTQTLKGGVRAGLATAAGVATGCLVHAALVVVGVAALIASMPVAFKALQWGGAAYLVWLAIGLVRDGIRGAVRVDATDEEIAGIVSNLTGPAAGLVQGPAAGLTGAPFTAPPQGASPVAPVSSAFVQGFTTNVLNPKVAIFFLALLPQFVRPDAPQAWLGLSFLGLWFAVQGFVFLAVFVKIAATLRRWQPTPERRRTLHLLAAAALILVALRLVTGAA